MGYRMEYEGISRQKKTQSTSGLRIIALTCLFWGIFIALVNIYWQGGREVLQELLWPGDPEITQQAVQAFITDLRVGMPIKDAIEGFCREIILHGN